MKTYFQFLRTWREIILTTAIMGLAACGSPAPITESAYNRQIAKAATSTGTFSGNWVVKLKNTSDGCGMGLKGKSYNANVAITQQRSKVTIAIQGFPKSFKGAVSNSTASGSGSYTSDGITMRGAVNVTKIAAKKIKVSSAVLNLKSSAQSCKLVFSGGGTKV